MGVGNVKWLALLVLTGCTQITFCEVTQVEQVAVYYHGRLVRRPAIDVTQPYCVQTLEEAVSANVVRKTFRCVVCREGS